MNEQDVRFESGDCVLAGTYTEAERPVAAARLAPVSPEVLSLVATWVTRHWDTP